MDADGFVSVKEGNAGSRKKKKGVTKRDCAKAKRYGLPVGHNLFVPCKHSNNSFQCVTFIPQDCTFVRTKLFSVKNKVSQDNFVASRLSVRQVKRRRPRSNNNKQPHDYSLKFTLPTQSGKTVSVCKRFFMSVLMVKSTRLRNIALKIKSGEHLTEKRGGDRKSGKSVITKEHVRQFLNKLKGKESHYNRKKSKRIYLDSSLNVQQLWRVYNKYDVSSEFKVSLSMFRRIFCNEFNIGFRSPASDSCSYCSRLDFLIKTTQNPEQTAHMIQKRAHKLRSNAFYELIREKTSCDTVSLCFDMQQVQALPKTPIQEAYYSRQVGFYNLCIVNLNQQNVPFFYVWTEDQAGRGANEVSSALLHYLNSLNLTGRKKIRLFCDGCAAQNKNNHVIHTIMYFLMSGHAKDIEIVQVTFPVRGHSYMPADRIFGQVEKKLRKKATILSKKEYIEVYDSVGVVKSLGNDWQLYNVKDLSQCFKRLDGISDMKRIFFKRITTRNQRDTVKVKACQYYRFESEAENYTSLLKRGWSIDRCRNVFNLQQIEPVHSVSAEKKDDVKKLLSKLFGDEWCTQEDLVWYKKLLIDLPSTESADEERACDCLEEDVGFHV